jgi:hypothetical protein
MKKKLPTNISQTHREVYETLTSLYPYHDLRLEFSVKRLLTRFYNRKKIPKLDQDLALINASAKLHFDIYDVTADVAIEIQGEQHFNFNKFFHQTMDKFDRQVKNDNKKLQVCYETNTKFIVIPTGTTITTDFIRECYEK